MLTLAEHENQIKESAAYYGVSLFLGNGQYDSYTTKTIEEAREVGAKMVAHHKNGRRPLIYAITKNGSATLITEGSK
jgi:hypothetical protein